MLDSLGIEPARSLAPCADRRYSKSTHYRPVRLNGFVIVLRACAYLGRHWLCRSFLAGLSFHRLENRLKAHGRTSQALSTVFPLFAQGCHSSSALPLFRPEWLLLRPRHPRLPLCQPFGLRIRIRCPALLHTGVQTSTLLLESFTAVHLLM